MSLKIVAIGRTQLLFQSVKLLLQSGYQVPLIISGKHTQSQYQFSDDDAIRTSTDMNIEYILTNNINDPAVIDQIRQQKADIAVSINYPNLICREVLEIFPMGVLNAHAGDLPKYRGNAVRNWAIINGEERIALTIHQMSVELDEGPVILKKYCDILAETTINELYDFTESSTPTAFLEAIKGLESGMIEPQPQPEESKETLRCYPRTPSDSLIDWNKPAIDVHRLIRASSEPFEGAYTYLNSGKLRIWRAELVMDMPPFLAVPGQVIEINKNSGTVTVATGTGVICLHEVQFEHDARVKPNVLFKSVRQRLGLNFEQELIELKLQLKIINNELSKLPDNN